MSQECVHAEWIQSDAVRTRALGRLLADREGGATWVRLDSSVIFCDSAWGLNINGKRVGFVGALNHRLLGQRFGVLDDNEVRWFPTLDEAKLHAEAIAALRGEENYHGH